jgi:threonine dehydratase
VPDSTLIAAMRLAHRELGLVLEPAGAAGLAALLDHREQFKGRLVATVLTGGNVSPANLREWLLD